MAANSQESGKQDRSSLLRLFPNMHICKYLFHKFHRNFTEFHKILRNIFLLCTVKCEKFLNKLHIQRIGTVCTTNQPCFVIVKIIKNNKNYITLVGHPYFEALGGPRMTKLRMEVDCRGKLSLRSIR